MTTKLDRRQVNDSLVSFNIDFKKEQKEARDVLHKNTIGILTGRAGTSKSMCAASVALELLFRKPKYNHEDYRYHGVYNKIYLVRPNVEAAGSDSIGFLPGDIQEKLEVYNVPMLSNMKSLLGEKGEETIKSLFDKKKLEILHMGFLRGMNIQDGEILLCDEFQNITDEQFKLITSRLCKGAKMIFTGDIAQKDIKKGSILSKLDLLKNLKGVGHFELHENYRHELSIKITEILDA